MNLSKSIRTLLATVAVAFSLLIVRAAETPAIVGAWDCTSTTSDGDDQTWTLTVTKDGDKLNATLGGGSLGDVTVSDFKAEADKATFNAHTTNGDYAVKLTVKGANIEGTFEGEQASGTIKGTKKS